VQAGRPGTRPGGTAAEVGEVVMGEVMSVRVEQFARLQNERAEALRAAHANLQALLDARAELSRTGPVAAAAHAYCAAWQQMMDSPGRTLIHCREEHGALLAAHRATTPSPTPPTHVIVAVGELEALRAIADAAGALMNDQQCEGDGDLRVALDGYPGGA
jgi:hypothetical protein